MLKQTIVILSALAGLAGCTADDKTPASTNNTSNDVTQNTTAEGAKPGNNGKADSLNSNVEPSGDTTPRRAEPYIAFFTYQRPARAGLTFASDGTLSTGRVGSLGDRQQLPPDIAAEFEALYMGPDTIDRMRAGWGCREVADTDADHAFKARIVEGEMGLEYQKVTGCVLDDDPNVQRIIKALERLETIYL